MSTHSHKMILMTQTISYLIHMGTGTHDFCEVFFELAFISSFSRILFILCFCFAFSIGWPPQFSPLLCLVNCLNKTNINPIHNIFEMNLTRWWLLFNNSHRVVVLISYIHSRSHSLSHQYEVSTILIHVHVHVHISIGNCNSLKCYCFHFRSPIQSRAWKEENGNVHSWPFSRAWSSNWCVGHSLVFNYRIT